MSESTVRLNLEKMHQLALDRGKPTLCLRWLPGKEETLEFLAGLPYPPQPHPESSPNTWMEGLWKWDVAEFFLGKPDGSYIEFNGNSIGAWWFGHFNGPRQPIAGKPDLHPSKFERIVKDNSWAVLFRIQGLGKKWSPLEGTKGWNLNLCAVKTEGERRSLWAAKDPKHLDPQRVVNFHDQEHWLDFHELDGQPVTLSHHGWI